MVILIGLTTLSWKNSYGECVGVELKRINHCKIVVLGTFEANSLFAV